MSKYVTREECIKAMEQVAIDIKVMKRALVGEDMRGGIVKDIAELKSKINEFNHVSTVKAELSLRWKIAILGSLVALIGILADLIIRAID